MDPLSIPDLPLGDPGRPDGRRFSGRGGCGTEAAGHPELEPGGGDGVQQAGEMGKVGVELGLPSILCPAGSEVSEPNISFLPSVANPGTGGSGEDELSCSPVGG